MSSVLLEFVSKRFGPVSALSGVSLEVRQGSRTAIIGPSGSGKTTMLRLIAGFEMPDSGRIALDGEIVADGTVRVPAHRRGIGFVSQDGALFPHLTVAANIGFGLDRGEPEREARIATLMEAVELDGEMAARRPHQLSGGQQQRVALARALARRPRLMLLDEPFSALDTSLRESVRKMVARVLGAAGVTTILVTHDQAEAMFFADQIAVLEKGRLMQAGAPRDLYLKPRDRIIASLLGEIVALPAELADGFAHCPLGRIPVDSRDGSGPATIILRPEQIRLAAASGTSRIRVSAVEFGGPASIVALAIEGAREPLWFRMSTADLLPVGSAVDVVVLGAAHLLS